MTDENVVGEVVAGRRIETEVLVKLVHGPADNAVQIVADLVGGDPRVAGFVALRSEEVVERQTVTVSKPLPEAPGCWLEARGYECTAHGERPVDELDAWWGTDD